MQDSTLFDGKTCSKCGSWKPFAEYHKDKYKPDGYTSGCKICRNLSTLDWFYKNQDRCNEKSKEWYYQNYDRSLKNSANYKATHRETIRADYLSSEGKAKKRQYWSTRTEKRAKVKRDFFTRHPGLATEYQRGWRARNPESCRAIGRRKSHQRRARELAGGSYSESDWKLLCVAYGHICLCCKEAKVLTVDHVIPIKRGGPNTIENLQPLCKPCNLKKGIKDTDYRWLSYDEIGIGTGAILQSEEI